MFCGVLGSRLPEKLSIAFNTSKNSQQISWCNGHKYTGFIYNDNSLHSHTAASGLIIFLFFQCHQDQMSLLEQERLQPQMLPAVQSAQYTLLRKYGELNGPQHVSDVEAKTAQQARKKIAARLTIAKLFHRYRLESIELEF